MLKLYKRELSKSSYKLVSFITIISLLVALFEFVSPLLIKYFIDNFKTSHLLIPLLIIVISYLLYYIFKIILSKVTNFYSVIFKTKEHNRLFNLMFHMKYDKLNSLEPTYLVERITNSVNTLFSLYSEAIPSFVISSFSISLSILLILFVDKLLALLLIVMVPLNILSYKSLNKKLSNMCVNLQRVCANNFMKIISVTSQVDYIKQSSDTSLISNILEPFITKIHKENAKVNKFSKFVSISISDIINIIHNGVYVYAATALLLKNISLSDFIFINLIISIYFPALNKIVQSNINLRDLKGIYAFISSEIIDNMEEDGNLKLEKIMKIEYKIENLAYGNNILIKNGNFIVEPGDIVKVNGESGSGKTTLMKGLVKFMSMNISINDIPISNYTNESIRNKISFFSQNIPIISGTIKDNILMGKTMNEDILELLNDKPFLKKFFTLNKGLETEVLENGSNLSGGDKQKIALARLYIEYPEVIILDEMTNSIDEITSCNIINSIIKEYKDKIIFIISHDNNTTKFCNKILNIEEKKLQYSTKNTLNIL
ncbi:MAG TPA: ABC transporter ATP-binding protein [Lachnospiraceae bacterium]|nr:ABC transporter ATP-binding protein [Lachnospiraceae bacterium]